MSTGELIGNVLGTAIALNVTKKYLLDPLVKKKQLNTYEDLFNLE